MNGMDVYGRLKRKSETERKRIIAFTTAATDTCRKATAWTVYYALCPFWLYFNPMEHTAGCQTFETSMSFACNSSFLSVDGMTCLIPFES